MHNEHEKNICFSSFGKDKETSEEGWSAAPALPPTHLRPGLGPTPTGWKAG